MAVVDQIGMSCMVKHKKSKTKKTQKYIYIAKLPHAGSVADDAPGGDAVDASGADVVDDGAAGSGVDESS